MLMKSCPARVKAAGPDDGLAEGQFRALVSVFGNKDSYGDVIMPGAFAETLAEWAASGDPIPVYYSHRMDDPDFNIGHVLEAKETDEGLEVLAQLDIDDPVPGSKAPQVHRLLKGRRITQFSFAYDVLEGGWAKRQDDGKDDEYYELRKLKLYEVGPTPIAANQETELLAVKSAAEGLAREVKAGRVISAKNEAALREARDSIDSVLAALEPAEDGKAAPAADQHDQEKASGEPEAKSGASDEEPEGAKSSVPDEEPGTDPSVDVLAASIEIRSRLMAGEGGPGA